MTASRHDTGPDLRRTAEDLPGGIPDRDKAEMELRVLRQLVAERNARLDAAHRRISALEAGTARLERQLKAAIRREQSALRRANHDPLTGLPNRGLLLDRLSQMLGQARRSGHMRVGVLFLDLDGFKAVNDRHGHLVGDALLKHVARRLQACLRATDSACRYGGDEFVVLLPELRTASGLQVVIDRVRESLEEPFQVEGQHIHLGASIGWALYPDHGQDPATLIRQADAAMYRGKQGAAGRNRRD